MSADKQADERKREAEQTESPMHEAEERDRKEHPERYPQGATDSPAREGEGKSKGKDRD